MKVTEHLKQAKDTLFSYEILPPLKGASNPTFSTLLFSSLNKLELKKINI